MKGLFYTTKLKFSVSNRGKKVVSHIILGKIIRRKVKGITPIIVLVKMLRYKPHVPMM